MYSIGKYSAQSAYDEWNTTQIKLKLNNKTDADILRWLKEQKYSRATSIQGAIKKLIREELAQQQLADHASGNKLQNRCY